MQEHENIPSFPRKLSRPQRRAETDRGKAFERELKLQAKGRNWKFAGGTIFRQEGDWFVSNLPVLAFQAGAITHWTCKPMAIDPLFWEIEGLEENNRMPLSFRAQGAWTLRPLFQRNYISEAVSDPGELAADVLNFSDEKLEAVKGYSVEQMLIELGPLDGITGSNRSLAVCLLILLDRFDQALEMCGSQDKAVSIYQRDSGGFISGDKTFFDSARTWITKRSMRTED